MAKHAAPQQCPKTENTRPKKGTKKARKSIRSTAQRISNAPVDLQQQQAQVQQPGASSSGYELSIAQQSTEPLETTAHCAVLGQAVQEAVNGLIAANWNIEYAAATQAMHRLSVSRALQILETVTATAPVDSNDWILERSRIAIGNQPQSSTQPQDVLSPHGDPPRFDTQIVSQSRFDKQIEFGTEFP